MDELCRWDDLEGSEGNENDLEVQLKPRNTPGSLGFENTPKLTIAKRASKQSPRSVLICQRAVGSCHRSEVTQAPKSALSYRPNLAAIARECRSSSGWWASASGRARHDHASE